MVCAGAQIHNGLIFNLRFLHRFVVSTCCLLLTYTIYCKLFVGRGRLFIVCLEQWSWGLWAPTQ